MQLDDFVAGWPNDERDQPLYLGSPEFTRENPTLLEDVRELLDMLQTAHPSNRTRTDGGFSTPFDGGTMGLCVPVTTQW